MLRRWWPWVVVLMFIMVLIVSVSASPALSEPAPLLRLKTGVIDPLQQPDLRKQADVGSLPDGPRLLLVQFTRPLRAEDKTALIQAGAEVGDYIPDFAYLVRAEADALPKLATISDVRWIGEYRPEYRVDPALTRRQTAGPVVAFTWSGQGPTLVRLTADPDQLRQLAQQSDMLWLAPATRRRLYNDVARSGRIMRVDSLWEQGLFGAGQIVGVADSGLDVGDLGRLSPDFAGRVVATLPLTGTTWNDAVGHGTHVTGSILGNGVLSGSDPAQHKYTGSFAGVAPEARLVAQAFQVDASSGEVFGLPDNLEQLFAPAYAAGARIHSNSWGGPADDDANPFGVYSPEAAAIDRFTWTHPDFLPLLAAGNDGTDGRFGSEDMGDGVVDRDSMSVAATAKNAIAVGASESLRASGGYASYPYALFLFNALFGGHGGFFLQEPIASDTMSDNPEGLAAFSGRGPTDDGRIKPDLVAPGTNIISTRSKDPGFDPSLYSWGLYESNENYVYNGGTSMATPLTAGAAALAREFHQRAGIANPSAALIKATLIHHAKDISPGQYGEGATREIQARPNWAEGWGRVDLGGLAPRPPVQQWVDDHTQGLMTGQEVVYSSSSYRLRVTDSSTPLRVTLVWTDYPAALTAARQLVNDLDLDLIAPSGTVYPFAVDRLNNVEMVEVARPESGQWSVVVKAYNIPHGPQPYALVVSGGFGGSAPTPLPTLTPPRPAPTPTLTPTPYNGPRFYGVYLPLIVTQ